MTTTTPPCRSTSDTTVACIGLGAMGGAMAASLVRTGYRVHGFDISTAACERLRQAGGLAVADPAAAATGAQVALIMVHDSKQVEQVLFGTRGIATALPRDAVVWVASTIMADDARYYARRLSASGLHMVDGPVSGGLTSARSAELIIIAGGTTPALQGARAVMQACARTIYCVGEAGAGSTVKMINNLLAASHVALTAEALAFGKRAGVDPGQLIEVIMQSSGSSRMFERRAPRILAGDHSVHATVETFRKDLGIALDTAKTLSFPTPLAAAAHQVFTIAARAGLAHQSDTTLIQIYETPDSINVNPI